MASDELLIEDLLLKLRPAFRLDEDGSVDDSSRRVTQILKLLQAGKSKVRELNRALFRYQFVYRKRSDGTVFTYPMGGGWESRAVLLLIELDACGELSRIKACAECGELFYAAGRSDKCVCSKRCYRRKYEAKYKEQRNKNAIQRYKKKKKVKEKKLKLRVERLIDLASKPRR